MIFHRPDHDSIERIRLMRKQTYLYSIKRKPHTLIVSVIGLLFICAHHNANGTVPVVVPTGIAANAPASPNTDAFFKQQASTSPYTTNTSTSTTFESKISISNIQNAPAQVPFPSSAPSTQEINVGGVVKNPNLDPVVPTSQESAAPPPSSGTTHNTVSAPSIPILIPPSSKAASAVPDTIVQAPPKVLASPLPSKPPVAALPDSITMSDVKTAPTVPVASTPLLPESAQAVQNPAPAVHQTAAAPTPASPSMTAVPSSSIPAATATAAAPTQPTPPPTAITPINAPIAPNGQMQIFTTPGGYQYYFPSKSPSTNDSSSASSSVNPWVEKINYPSYTQNGSFSVQNGSEEAAAQGYLYPTTHTNSYVNTQNTAPNNAQPASQNFLTASAQSKLLTPTQQKEINDHIQMQQLQIQSTLLEIEKEQLQQQLADQLNMQLTAQQKLTAIKNGTLQGLRQKGIDQQTELAKASKPKPYYLTYNLNNPYDVQRARAECAGRNKTDCTARNAYCQWKHLSKKNKDGKKHACLFKCGAVPVHHCNKVNGCHVDKNYNCIAKSKSIF